MHVYLNFVNKAVLRMFLLCEYGSVGVKQGRQVCKTKEKIWANVSLPWICGHRKEYALSASCLFFFLVWLLACLCMCMLILSQVLHFSQNSLMHLSMTLSIKLHRAQQISAGCVGDWFIDLHMRVHFLSPYQHASLVWSSLSIRYTPHYLASVYRWAVFRFAPHPSPRQF